MGRRRLCPPRRADRYAVYLPEHCTASRERGLPHIVADHQGDGLPLNFGVRQTAAAFGLVLDAAWATRRSRRAG